MDDIPWEQDAPTGDLAELFGTLARRQHQHRSHTVARLATVIESHPLPADLHHMAL
ncbi:hypothetical protein ACF065_35265 [Streptomyces sp. NPDC015232]|uniref:hypothetical protein n=1 Tax=unclassified Streptomyces TaxID=2593676 RepID=UPI0037023A48